VPLAARVDLDVVNTPSSPTTLRFPATLGVNNHSRLRQLNQPLGVDRHRERPARRRHGEQRSLLAFPGTRGRMPHVGGAFGCRNIVGRLSEAQTGPTGWRVDEQADVVEHSPVFLHVGSFF
jgi:hypothetical protein